MATKTNQELASLFVEEEKFRDRLLYDRETDSYWYYTGKIWRPMSKQELRDEVARLVWERDNTNRMTVGKMDDIIKQLSQYLGEDSVYKKIRTYGYKVEAIEEMGISFNDGIFLYENKSIIEHAPSLDRLALVHLAFNYADISKAECPIFDAYLKTTCLDEDGDYNEGMATQLQEVAGWILSNERAEKFIILQGTGGNGKTPYLNLLTAAVGKDRTISMSIEDMTTDRFALWEFLGKKLNAMDEDESKAINASKLKAIVSGSLMRTQRKFGDGFSMMVRAKNIFATNAPPCIENLDQAMKRRIIIIPFEHTMEEKNFDRNLARKMVKNEMPGIIRWMLAGMEKIQAQNCVFTQTTQSQAAMDSFESANSSVIEYIKEYWELDIDNPTPASEVYGHYVQWCKDTGHRPVSSNKFGRRAVPLIGKARSKELNERRVWCYHVRLKPGVGSILQNKRLSPDQIAF